MEESKFFEHLAELVRNHRKQSKLSQAQLADFAGVGKTVVYDIEHAKSTLKLNTVIKILSALNITIHFSSPLLSKGISKNAKS